MFDEEDLEEDNEKRIDSLLYQMLQKMTENLYEALDGLKELDQIFSTHFEQATIDQLALFAHFCAKLKFIPHSSLEKYEELFESNGE